MNEITGDTYSNWGFVAEEGSFDTIEINFTKIEHSTVLVGDMLDLLNQANEATGSYVDFRPEFSFCPVLKNDLGQVLLLYKFIEILDECLDYEEVKEEIPSFSFGQINGAISFLRKIAQFNLAGVDIDAEIDMALLESPAFKNELKNALADQESRHVLNLNQCDR